MCYIAPNIFLYSNFPLGHSDVGLVAPQVRQRKICIPAIIREDQTLYSAQIQQSISRESKTWMAGEEYRKWKMRYLLVISPENSLMFRHCRASVLVCSSVLLGKSSQANTQRKRHILREMKQSNEK